MRMFDEFIGKKYGNLTITAFDSYKKNGTPVFAVTCDCGNDYLKTGLDRLESGKTKDCGCSKRNTNLIGKKFGRLLVVEKTDKRVRYHIVWKCKCECGNEVYVSSHDLITKKSCGCIMKEKEHFAVGTRIHKVWGTMNDRCYSKNREKDCKSYRIKNIQVCDDWRGSNPKGFSNFYDWAMKNGYKEEIMPNGKNKWTLERIDNSKGYSPENCKWATYEEQQRNKDNRLLIEYNGVKYTCSELSKIIGIDKTNISNRYRSGWSIEKIIKTPISKHYHKKLIVPEGYICYSEVLKTFRITERQLRRVSDLGKLPYQKYKNAKIYKVEDVKKFEEFILEYPDFSVYNKYSLFSIDN